MVALRKCHLRLNNRRSLKIITILLGQYSIPKSFPFFILISHYHTHSGNTSLLVNLAVVRWLVVSYEDENEYSKLVMIMGIRSKTDLLEA